jgi:SAP domain-containing new25
MAEFNETDYQLVDLQNAARERGLSTSGTKAELTERLNEYESAQTDAPDADEPDADKPDADEPDANESTALPDQDDEVGKDAQETDTVPDEALTGAQQRAKAIDDRRAAERADVESETYGEGSEMAKWHELHGEGKSEAWMETDEYKQLAEEAENRKASAREAMAQQREATSGNQE